MLETCRGGPRSIILRIENVDQDFQKQPWRPKWTNCSQTGFHKFEAPSEGLPYMLERP